MRRRGSVRRIRLLSSGSLSASFYQGREGASPPNNTPTPKPNPNKNKPPNPPPNNHPKQQVPPPPHPPLHHHNQPPPHQPKPPPPPPPLVLTRERLRARPLLYPRCAELNIGASPLPNFESSLLASDSPWMRDCRVNILIAVAPFLGKNFASSLLAARLFR